MIITLKRNNFRPDCTTGKLLGPNFQCCTLEDTVRAPGIKVPGATAIPEGKYEVVISWSNKFGKYLPLLLNVPQFGGVRIHSGNTAADTEGCILVGTEVSISGGAVLNSRMAFRRIFPVVREACKVGKVWLQIRNVR